MAEPKENKVLLYLKAITSNEAMQQLHDARKKIYRQYSADGQDGVRTRAAIVISIVLLVLSGIMLVATAWVPQDVRSYISSREGIKFVTDESVQWFATDLSVLSCSIEDSCYRELKRQEVKPRSSQEIDAFVNNEKANAFSLVRLRLKPQVLDGIKDESAVAVALPAYVYKRAQVYLDNRVIGSFHNSQQILITVAPSSLTEGSEGKSIGVPIDVVFELTPTEREFAGVRNNQGVLVATLSEFGRYQNFVGAMQSNAVGKMGHLTKIVLALFCLMLFLIIDSSPESFGLALFMGLEAVAMGAGEGWLPAGWLGLGHESVFVNYFYQMGDLMKLYFLLQMARVGKPNPLPWLIWGTLASVPYGFFMDFARETSIDWVFKIPRTRDTVVGTIGFFVCYRALWILRKEKLPWRKTALAIAGWAAAFEVINSWIAHSQIARNLPQAKTLFTVLQAHVGYLFTLSTFLNISTLENRVKALSKEKNRTDAIERELEIGQIVQKALHKPPLLPGSVALTCHHEAALYVSGDTYYANWDKSRDIVTFLVNDVTGHGVQAALKASACNVLAKTVWENDKNIDAASDGRRLVQFNEIIEKLLTETDSTPDFNSLVGAEFNFKNGMLCLYRSNFTFPVLISPKVEFADDLEPFLGEFWIPEVLVSRNQEILQRRLKRGSFLLFMSDGFMESSRDMKQFIGYLRIQLASKGTNVTVASITELVLRYEQFVVNRTNDDRTLMAFQWTLDRRRLSMDNDELQKIVVNS